MRLLRDEAEFAYIQEYTVIVRAKFTNFIW